MITTIPQVHPWGAIHSHLKVITKTEAVPLGGGRHWSDKLKSRANVVYTKKPWVCSVT